MNTPDTVKAIGAALKTADLKAERERSPVLAAAYDAATSAGVTLSTANTVLAGEKADLLAKAKALTDQLTRVQHENGQIPTHWMNTPDAEANFWFNCMFESCRVLALMSEYDG